MRLRISPSSKAQSFMSYSPHMRRSYICLYSRESSLLSKSEKILFLSLSKARVITWATAGRFTANSLITSPMLSFSPLTIRHACSAMSHWTPGFNPLIHHSVPWSFIMLGLSFIILASRSIDSSETRFPGVTLVASISFFFSMFFERITAIISDKKGGGISAYRPIQQSFYLYYSVGRE